MGTKVKIIIILSILAISTTVLYLRSSNFLSIKNTDSLKNFISQSNEAEYIYSDLLKKINSDSFEAHLIAIYFAQTVLKANTPTYNNFWHQLETTIKENSEEVFKILITNQEAIKNNPFYHQIYLNLLSDLTIKSEAKTKAIGKSLEQRIDFNSNNEITEQNASIVVALILLKKNGYQMNHLLPSIQKGIELNENSPKSLEEYKARIKAYISTLNLDTSNLYHFKTFNLSI